SIRELQITKMKVFGWSANDLDGAELKKIKINNSTVFNGTANDGDLIDITDYNLSVSSSSSANGNALEFDKQINDDGEQFQITFEFSDLSQFTTTILST
ncbi:MAG TPA: hypothetical protein VJK05_00680, partial [archaeon]|nr:hypothetical protein [archaeon]